MAPQHSWYPLLPKWKHCQDIATVDLSKLMANLADGVLVVSAPKKARTEPVSITITTEFHKASEVSPDEKTEKA